jgi:RNA recognition motif-containing protein
VRRSYHPNPPAQRSEWVMWAGNVPADANEAELVRFFREIPAHLPIDSSTRNGVISVFLITRTNCAFVNFESESSLLNAITKFNGQALRPNDPRCARLLCRVRRKDDDLRAGVGGQRGMGMHTRWIKEQQGKAAKASDSSAEQSDSSDAPPTPSSLGSRPSNASSDDDAMLYNKGSSSGSFASTNSSVLTRHFPQRYFILKSLSQVCPTLLHR